MACDGEALRRPASGRGRTRLGRSGAGGEIERGPDRLGHGAGRPVSTRNPVTPSSTYVAGPPAAGPTTTSPAASASISARPNSSLRLPHT